MVNTRYRITFIALTLIGLSLAVHGMWTTASAAPAQAVTPFLYPPYPGTASQESVFDHTSPNYTQDNRVVAYNGAVANKTCPSPAPAGIPPAQSGVCDAGYGIYWSYGLGDWIAYDGHDGIDYGMSYRPIYAAADADQVIYAGWWDPQNHKTSLGLYVRLHHPNGYSTSYGHMSAVAVQTCTTPGCVYLPHGEWIGFSGNTGNSSGPHLHLRLVNPSGKAVDPYGWGGSGTDPWSSNQKESLWVQYPSLTYYGAVIFPSGGQLGYPSAPTNGIVIDDASSGWSESPAACWSTGTATNATGGGMRYVKPRTGVANCVGQWAFPQGSTPGMYAVYVRVPSNHATVEGAMYEIQHNGKLDRAFINQVVYPNRFFATDGWIYVGKYNFSSQGGEYVKLGNQTLDELAAVASMELGADSVQFVYLGDATPTPPAVVTLTPTNTRTATYTPSNTPTPTVTRTPTNTLTPTITRTPTVTRTPTATRTPTRTPTATNTRPATATPQYYKLKIYFVNTRSFNANTPPFEVFGTRYLASSSNMPEGILKEYFKGPGLTEKYTYGWSAIYNGFTGYSKFEVLNGVAHVYLTGTCSASGRDYTIADLITVNLKQFGNIQAVKIYDQFGQTMDPTGAGDSEPLCLDPAFTPSPTATVSPTITRTPTATRTPTPTRTPTKTPTASKTPRPTVTPQYLILHIYFVDQAKYLANTPPFEVRGDRWAKSSADYGKFILDEYFKGPGYTEKYTYKWMAIYSGFTGYSKYEVIDGVAHVYLKGTCNSFGKDYNIADLLMVNLKQYGYIQFVKIYDENGSTQNPDGPVDSVPACLAP